MAWNSVDSGPRRDLVGDLTKAVRDVGLKMGLYYSIWDWFNPYWPEADQPTRAGKTCNETTLAKYVHEVMYPQFKEIVNLYQPSLIFSDGDWWMDEEKWETKPLLAWLFNNAPNMDELVINDRWGKVRGKHGGYFSTEYGSGFADPSILWEECRGIGKSFGYSRVETYDDYNSGELLIYMLCDIVSRGGNLLLDIGPTADGRIPIVMEDRLIQIGEWLEVNGEAIHGTRRWKKDCQWSEGEIREYTKEEFHKGVPDPVIEMAKYPREGQARKECYFTAKGDTVYAMITVLPDNGRFEIDDIELGKDSKVTMLGVDRLLKTKKRGNGIVVTLPTLNPSKLPCEHVYTLKLTSVK
jgi:alpha-L-fucosidase